MSVPKFVKLAADATITSADGWQDLLTTTLTVDQASSKILAIFTTSFASFAGGGYNTHFRVLLDGVAQPCSASGAVPVSATNAACGATAYFSALSAGPHTLKLQWNTENGDTRILAGAAPDVYSADLYVEEYPTTGTAVLATEKAPLYDPLAVDSTALNAFSVLHTTTYTTIEASAQLLIVVSLATQLTLVTGSVVARVMVDGASVGGMAYTSFPGSGLEFGAAPMVRCPTVAAGAHTIDVEWHKTAGTAVVCNPATASEVNCCTILAQEKAA